MGEDPEMRNGEHHACRRGGLGHSRSEPLADFGLARAERFCQRSDCSSGPASLTGHTECVSRKRSSQDGDSSAKGWRTPCRGTELVHVLLELRQPVVALTRRPVARMAAARACRGQIRRVLSCHVAWPVPKIVPVVAANMRGYLSQWSPPPGAALG